MVYCKAEKAQRTKLPKEGENILKFKNIHKQLKCPFIVYADFESKLVKTEDAENIQKTGIVNEVLEEEETVKNTIHYNTHNATSFGYKIISFNEEECPVENSYFTFCGENAAEVFVEKLQEKATEIYNQYITQCIPMNPSKDQWTADELEAFSTASVCSICNQSFKKDEIRVPDHCRYTGR